MQSWWERTHSCSGCTDTGTCIWCHNCGSGSPSAARDAPMSLFERAASRRSRDRPSLRWWARWRRGTSHEWVCPWGDLGTKSSISKCCLAYTRQQFNNLVWLAESHTCRIADFFWQLDAGIAASSSSLLPCDTVASCFAHFFIPSHWHIGRKLGATKHKNRQRCTIEDISKSDQSSQHENTWIPCYQTHWCCTAGKACWWVPPSSV